ncbi:MAG: signal peptidase I, partial [Nitrospirae bacterium]|nr:signal peptidase I [Nitrospirota bacterium]
MEQEKTKKHVIREYAESIIIAVVMALIIKTF